MQRLPHSRPADPRPGWPSTAADLWWLAALVAVVATVITRNLVLDRPQAPVLEIGIFRLGPFGLLLAADVLFGWHLTRRWCERFAVPWEPFARRLPWVILIAFVGSHLFSVVAYFPSQLSLATLADLRFGMSSLGGIACGAAAAVAFLRRDRLPAWPYVDALTYGFVGGYVFGRAGCFAVHDHPGRATDHWLAVEIDGVRRHDLGFYEMLLMLGLLALLTALAHRRRPPGAFFAVAALVYAPSRFALDRLRIEDAQYAGLTPAQWLTIPLALAGVLAARRAWGPKPRAG